MKNGRIEKTCYSSIFRSLLLDVRLFESETLLAVNDLE